MCYLVMLEGGKLIPVLGLFRHLFHFYRGVSNTIYSTSWRWPSADRVPPYVTLHTPVAAFREGHPTLGLSHFRHIWDKNWQHLGSRERSRAEPSRAAPSRADPGEPTQAEPPRQSPPNQSPSRAPPPSDRVIQPNTQSPACGFLLVKL